MDTQLHNRVRIGIALIIALVVGVGVWYVGYQQGWNGAKARVTSLGLFSQLKETKTVTGVVDTITGDVLTLNSVMTDPFASTDLKERIITVTSATTFTRMKAVDAAVYQKEFLAYTEQVKKSASATSTTSQIYPPAPFIPEAITLQDIHVGDHIVVTAQENIVHQKQFNAVSIFVSIPPPVTTKP